MVFLFDAFLKFLESRYKLVDYPTCKLSRCRTIIHMRHIISLCQHTQPDIFIHTRVNLVCSFQDFPGRTCGSYSYALITEQLFQHFPSKLKLQRKFNNNTANDKLIG